MRNASLGLLFVVVLLDGFAACLVVLIAQVVCVVCVVSLLVN